MSSFSISVKRRAFTLVELLVVIAIIGVLVALLLPAVQAAREAARRAQCMNNQKQLGLALHNYHDAFKSFPIGSLFIDATNPWHSQRTTWLMRLLPFVEQTALYDQIDQSQIPGHDGANATAQKTKIPGYRCPSDAGKINPALIDNWGATSYVACLGNAISIRGEGGNTSLPTPKGAPNTFWAAVVFNNGTQKGVFSSNSHTAIKDITDGTSNTMAASECIAGGEILVNDIDRTGFFDGTLNDCIENTPGSSFIATDRGYSWFRAQMRTWTFNTIRTPNPDRLDCESLDSSGNMSARSFHPAGVQVLLCDGSVRFVSDTINRDTWRNLGDKADGNVLDEY